LFQADLGRGFIAVALNDPFVVILDYAARIGVNQANYMI